MFKKRKLAKKLAEVGSRVDVSYMVYLNNDEGKSFPSRDGVQSYIDSYRDTNSIFNIQIYRIEVYSL